MDEQADTEIQMADTVMERLLDSLLVKEEVLEQKKKEQKQAKDEYELIVEKIKQRRRELTEPTLFNGEEAIRSVAKTYEEVELFEVQGFPVRITYALGDIGVMTLGKLQKWLNDGHQYTELKDVGEAMAEQAANALLNFWENNQDLYPPVKGEIDEETGEVTDTDTDDD